MKVETWVDFSKEIEVEISAEDAVNAIFGGSEDPPDFYLKQVVNRFYSVLKRMPDDVFDKLTPSARKLIYEGLTEQVNRFQIKEEVR